MYPTTVALVDDDHDYTEYLAEYLQGLGMAVRVFADSNDLLAHEEGQEADFYVVDLMLPGISGIELVKVLRQRSPVGVLVVSGRLGPEVFKEVIEAGADMYLAKPVQFEQVALAIQAVQRRATPASSQASAVWRLDPRARVLIAPDQAEIALSESDVLVLESLLESQPAPVTRAQLLERLGREPSQDADESLNATIYRLRQRIKKATPALVPLQTKSRVGYWFQAKLERA